MKHSKNQPNWRLVMLIGILILIGIISTVNNFKDFSGLQNKASEIQEADTREGIGKPPIPEQFR